MNLTSALKLNTGTEIPLFGLGVYIPEEGSDTVTAVRWALEAGYRHIDTASFYANEKSVGEAVRKSGVPREEIFVTTKIWNDDMRQGRQREAFEESFRALDLGYIDLYLIHWPVENFLETWKILEEIYASGKVRAVGVSNFSIHHLETLFAHSSLVPAVNQFECHPGLSQNELISFCREKGIVSEAYSPLGSRHSDLWDNTVLLRIAKDLDRTVAQVMLRWNLQREVVVIPKSARRERILSNSELYDFSLSEEQMTEIGALGQNHRFGAHPDTFTF